MWSGTQRSWSRCARRASMSQSPQRRYSRAQCRTKDGRGGEGEKGFVSLPQLSRITPSLSHTHTQAHTHFPIHTHFRCPPLIAPLERRRISLLSWLSCVAIFGRRFPTSFPSCASERQAVFFCLHDRAKHKQNRAHVGRKTKETATECEEQSVREEVCGKQWKFFSSFSFASRFSTLSLSSSTHPRVTVLTGFPRIPYTRRLIH